MKSAAPLSLLQICAFPFPHLRALSDSILLFTFCLHPNLPCAKSPAQTPRANVQTMRVRLRSPLFAARVILQQISANGSKMKLHEAWYKPLAERTPYTCPFPWCNRCRECIRCTQACSSSRTRARYTGAAGSELALVSDPSSSRGPLSWGHRSSGSRYSSEHRHSSGAQCPRLGRSSL
jgi:hypothetical protein